MVPSYYRPATVAEALQLKAELGPRAVFLAGGTEVNNSRFPKPEALIDLAELGLDKIEVSSAGTRLGACATFQQLLEHPGVPAYLKGAAGQMVNRNIRNRATVGGQLAMNRSCADLIPMLLAAEAHVTLAHREMPLEAYLTGEPGLVLSVFLPAANRGFGRANHTRTASDISIVAVAVSLAMEHGAIRHPVVAVGGVAAHVVRLHEVEQALEGVSLPLLDQVEALVAQAVHPVDDLRGSAAFKKQLAAVLSARALRDAVGSFESVDGAH